MRTAIVIGATGLVGGELVKQLLNTPAFTHVKVLVRKDFSIQHPRLEVIPVDFDNELQLHEAVKGDDLFIAIGTTRAKTPDMAQYRAIDYGIPVHVATVGMANEVKRIYFVSALGANPGASNFYLKLKGETEAALHELHPDQLVIVRPSLLLGNRKEHRTGEKIAKVVMAAFGWLMAGPLKKYKAVESTAVAAAMIREALNPTPGVTVLENNELV